MPKPLTPFQPYAAVHANATRPGDARPTALQIVDDNHAVDSLRRQAIVVTGCSSGLGVETARALYETGARLFLTARDPGKLEAVIEEIVTNSQKHLSPESRPPRPVAVRMHLDSLKSVRQGAEEIRRQTDSVYALVNNAGVMACPYGTTEDGLEMQLGVNHFAHLRLYLDLEPLLRNAARPGRPSRVVNLTSLGHRISPIRFDDIGFSGGNTYHKWLSYGQSKTANIYMTNSITRNSAAHGVIGLSVHPGVIFTELMRHMDQSDHDFMKGRGAFENMKSVEQGAATAVWAVLAPHFDEIENGGRYLSDVGESTEHAPHAYDEESEERLWKLSMEVLNEKA